MTDSNRFQDSRHSESLRFVKTRSAISRRFREHKVQSWHALQYWLCEVGPPRDREDPRALRPAITIRGTPLRPDIGGEARPWEPLRGFFVSPTLMEVDVLPAVDNATNTMDRLNSLLNGEDVRTIGESVSRGLIGHGSSVDFIESRPVPLGGEITASSSEALVDLSELAGIPILASITNDPEWLYPDDPRIWRHLVRCKANRAYPVFIARKMSIATFPVLKRVSALGIQLHQLFVQDAVVAEAQRCSEELNWLNIGTVSQVEKHAGLNVIRDELRGITRNFALQAAYDSSMIGSSIGLTDDAHASPKLLLSWVEKAKIEMPDKWHAVVQEWATWDQRGLLRKPYRPDKWV